MRQIKNLIGPHVSLAAVVKSDAYGLGAVGIAESLIDGGADLLAVARYAEAAELKREHPDLAVPVLIMGLCSDDEFSAAAEQGFLITIDSYRQAKILSDTGLEAYIHVKVDTGFSRLGLKAKSAEALKEYADICNLPGITIGGIFSHLALEGPQEDEEQFNLFKTFIKEAEKRGLPTGQKHICDSIGLSRYPQYRLDMVRAGAILYGMRPFRAPLIDSIPLNFPVEWTAPIIKITELKEGEGVSYDYSWKAPAGGARIATLPVGYGDGYKRSLSNKGEVLIQGIRCPVVGIICMDQMMVDITSVKDAAPGERAILLGEDPAILDLSRWAQTNRNDIQASIGRRVSRIYTRKGQVVSRLDYLSSPSFRRIE